MKSPIPLFRTLLLNDPAVTSILGGNKVWANEIPQNTTRPAIRLIEISGTPIVEVVEHGGGPIAWDRRVSVECQGDGSQQADDLAVAALGALDGVYGVFGDLDVQALRVISDALVYEDLTRVVLRIIDFRIVYGNAA